MRGGMYLFPPAFAFLVLMLVMLVSKGVISIEDANQDGIPDILQPGVLKPATPPISMAPPAKADSGKDQSH